MITLDDMRAAVRANDEFTDGGGTIPEFCTKHDIETDGLAHVGMQRAMRAVMFMMGEELTEENARNVMADPELATLLAMVAGVWVDGFSAGTVVR